MKKQIKSKIANKIYNGIDSKGRLIENSSIVRCPKCGSSRIEALHPFDYAKMCKKCKHEFSTGVHN